MALIHARDYLTYATAEQQTDFLEIAATCRKITGPAGALRCYLAKVTWFSNRQGHLETAFDVPLHLVHSNLEDLLMFLHLSWMIIVADHVCTRQGMRGAPTVWVPYEHSKQWNMIFRLQLVSNLQVASCSTNRR